MRARTFASGVSWLFLAFAVLALLGSSCKGCGADPDDEEDVNYDDEPAPCGGVHDESDNNGPVEGDADTEENDDASEGESEGESEAEEEHGELYPLVPGQESYTLRSGDVTVVFADIPANDLQDAACADDPELQALLAVFVASDGLLADLPTLTTVYVGQLDFSQGCTDEEIARGLSIAAYEAMLWEDCYCGTAPPASKPRGGGTIGPEGLPAFWQYRGGDVGPVPLTPATWTPPTPGNLLIEGPVPPGKT